MKGSRCVCWGRGRRGPRGEGGHLLSASVGECCEWRVGAGEALIPSAHKQCPRRVFYGSCWTLISFVARLSSAAAALSPQKRARTPLPPSPPTESHAPRVYGPTRGPQRASQYPLREKCVTNQLLFSLCVLEKIIKK